MLGVGAAQAAPGFGAAQGGRALRGQGPTTPGTVSTSLGDALFGTRSADRHFGSAPPIARYEIDATSRFVLDRGRGGALLKFETSPEVWALTAVMGPRGDVIYKNDTGAPVLRATRLGGVTLFTDTRPEGEAASLVGQASTLRVGTVIGPDALLHALSAASARASHAAQHLVVFEAPEVAPSSDWVFADAAWLAAEAFARLSLHGAAARPLITRFFQVTLTPGRAPAVQAAGSVVQIVVSPEQGVAGRPSSERIYTVLSAR